MVVRIAADSMCPAARPAKFSVVSVFVRELPFVMPTSAVATFTPDGVLP